MEAAESGPVRQCPPGLIYLETVISPSLDPKPSCHMTDGPPLVPDVFPRDAAESAAIFGDVPAARKEAERDAKIPQCLALRSGRSRNEFRQFGQQTAELSISSVC